MASRARIGHWLWKKQHVGPSALRRDQNAELRRPRRARTRSASANSDAPSCRYTGASVFWMSASPGARLRASPEEHGHEWISPRDNSVRPNANKNRGMAFLGQSRCSKSSWPLQITGSHECFLERIATRSRLGCASSVESMACVRPWASVVPASSQRSMQNQWPSRSDIPEPRRPPQATWAISYNW